MKKALIFGMAAVFGLVLFMGAAPAQAADQTFVTIGTGGVTGVYYPTGGAICRLVNKGTQGARHPLLGGEHRRLGLQPEHHSRPASWTWASPSPTGSTMPITAPANSRTQGPNKDLRAVFSVHPEPFTVVARADSGIKNFKDLKGKRVNIGNPGSGQRGTMEVVMAAMGWTMDDFKLASELKSAEQSSALCDNKIDAIVFTVGHPSGSIQEATTSCDSVLVNVTGPEIDKLVSRQRLLPQGHHSRRHVPRHRCRHQTFGVGATFVTSCNVPEDVIYNVVKAVFENFDEFKKLHPAFENLKKEEMIKDGLSAPLHDGAVKYYKEAGLM